MTVHPPVPLGTSRRVCLRLFEPPGGLWAWPGLLALFRVLAADLDRIHSRHILCQVILSILGHAARPGHGLVHMARVPDRDLELHRVGGQAAAGVLGQDGADQLAVDKPLDMLLVPLELIGQLMLGRVFLEHLSLLVGLEI